MNKEFTIKDLRTGHIVVTKGEGNAFVLGSRLKKYNQINYGGGLADISRYRKL